MVDAVAEPDRRRTGQAVLRRQRRRVDLVGPLGADRGAGPAARRLRVLGAASRWSPWISDDCGGAAGDRHARLQPRRLPRGQLRAQARATCSRSRWACRATTTRRTWHALGRAGRRDLLQQPDGLRRQPRRRSPRLAARAAQPAAGRRPGRLGGSTRPARCRAPGRSPNCSPSKGIRHELDVWGYDVPHDWPSWQAQLRHHLPRFC